MHIRALRTSFGDYGLARKGQIVDVPDFQAKELIKKGSFEGLRAEEAASGEAPLSPSGGRTGEATSSSSSPAAPAPRKSRSTKRKGAAE